MNFQVRTISQYCFQLVDNKLRQEIITVESGRQSQGSRVKESPQPLWAYKSQVKLYPWPIQEERSSRQHLLEQPANFLKSLGVIFGPSFKKPKLFVLASSWLRGSPAPPCSAPPPPGPQIAVASSLPPAPPGSYNPPSPATSLQIG